MLKKSEARSKKLEARKKSCLLPLASCIFFSCLLLTVSYAQETVSLSSIIEEARINNPELQALREKVKAREFAAKVEGVLDDPTFKVEIEDIPEDKPFNLGDSMQTRYTFSQMFPFPGKLSLKQC